MCQLAACCLLLLACLPPFLALPAPHSGAAALRLSGKRLPPLPGTWAAALLLMKPHERRLSLGGVSRPVYELPVLGTPCPQDNGEQGEPGKALLEVSCIANTITLCAAAEGGGPARGRLDSAPLSLPRGLRGTPGAEAAEALRRADPGTNVYNPRGHRRTASSGQGPAIVLNRLLARIREQHGKRGPRSECFWKYCV
ncbi:urotensin-2 [Pipistrellus kuhlii]|uniref:urotensin-2 n=1 Tax=Pipistrellus kuhlii TaxID=59472 RepID=UPI001E26EAF9|nr:urotensin-2 [Pipistrellus kuhlii]